MMPRFFIDYIPEERAILTGPDAHHIAKSLRMWPGEPLILCDSIGTDYNCEIEQIDGETVTVKVLNFCRSVSEPSVFVTLYQAFPKADKMDAVVQKSVELGVSRIVPMLSERCVSRPDEKAVKKKADRWQKIAEEAAKQSGRGVIPQVAPSLPFRAAIQEAEKEGEILFFYEGGGEHISALVGPKTQKLSLFIGPEGGFAEAEVRFAQEHGAKIATLGPRILRTETAPIAALAAIMLATDNL